MKVKDVLYTLFAAVITGVTVAFIQYLFARDIEDFKYYSMHISLTCFTVMMGENLYVWYKERKKKAKKEIT